MARRRIGQESFGLGDCRGGRHSSLDDLAALIDWPAVERHITPANIDDGKAGPDALPDDPGDVFADSAYRGNHFETAVRAKGGTPRIVATGMWGRDEQRARNLAAVEASCAMVAEVARRADVCTSGFKAEKRLTRTDRIGKRRNCKQFCRSRTCHKLNSPICFPGTGVLRSLVAKQHDRGLGRRVGGVRMPISVVQHGAERLTARFSIAWLTMSIFRR
jgi:hypothetical protein